VWDRHGKKLSGSPVHPAVVGALERRGVAAVRATNQVASVTTLVEQNQDAAVVPPDHDERISREVSNHEIPGTWYFRLMTHIEPHLGKDPLDLEIKDRGVTENPAWEQTLLQAATDSLKPGLRGGL
jgi:hypothetical protein